MFLLVSVRHVGAHPDEHQRGVFIQISINLGKTFLRISHIRNIPLIWILARVLFSIYLLSVLRFWTLFNGFDFYFDLLWMAWHWKPAIPALFLRIKNNRQNSNATLEKFQSMYTEYTWAYECIWAIPCRRFFSLTKRGSSETVKIQYWKRLVSMYNN